MKVGQALDYGIRWARVSTLSPGDARLPREVNLPITDNCNARCVMCDVWKSRAEHELAIPELARILRQPLFAEVEHLGISGGEPSLRRDLPEIVACVVDALDSLKSLSITTHGFHTGRWTRWFPLVLEASSRVSFTLNVSLDGLGTVHNRVRGIPGAFEKSLATIRSAQAAGITTRVQATLSAVNVFGAPELLEWANAEQLEISFRAATTIARLDNQTTMAGVHLSQHQASFMRDFLESPALLGATRSPARRLFYRDLAPRLTTATPRRAPCAYQNEAVLLTAQGTLFPCSIANVAYGSLRNPGYEDIYSSEKARKIRRDLIEKVCPTCVHDQSGTWSPALVLGEVLNQNILGRGVSLGVRTSRLVARSARAWPPALAARALETERVSPASSWPRIICVGAYGGEHVGDAAILGGVLLRMHREHGTERAVIVSSRPHRTARWVDCLQLPIPVEVISNSRASRARAVACADAVVHAGGPVMDLPELLVEHLETSEMARTAGIPFAFEGIGVGPFRLRSSEATARFLLNGADHVTVRSTHAAAHRALGGRKVDVTPDPAFDYLATRDKATALHVDEAASLDAVFEGLQGRTLIGINLRPLWSKYGGKNRAEVRAVEEKALVDLGAALRKLGRERSVAVLFFPMNADQYGFSDLTIAAKLRRQLDGVEYRIWHAEPGVDAVICFLRRVDVVVAMRFHACIFALSQRRPTLALDYSLRGVGKVGRLMQERGLGNDVVSITAIDPEFVAAKLRDLDRGAIAEQSSRSASEPHY